LEESEYVGRVDDIEEPFRPFVEAGWTPLLEVVVYEE
jgi:hypothetical protein